jgi:hypothetical protein
MPVLFGEPFIETLRLALQRERGSFSNFHGGTPIRPLTVVGSEVGAKLKGLDQRFKELRTKEKGALRPFVAVAGASRTRAVYTTRRDPE